MIAPVNDSYGINVRPMPRSSPRLTKNIYNLGQLLHFFIFLLLICLVNKESEHNMPQKDSRHELKIDPVPLNITDVQVDEAYNTFLKTRQFVAPINLKLYRGIN